ncbi:flagellar filament capping protein FliD [Sphingomonas rubra]|uniref:Flagellar hook-associated protein 2 n=1 Tax=Sphingomonas rubra TaxID=634430 RepID=A0A1I5UKC6_9SPHN|nr:flagellar filament capping protein FliD [Sphingomonas rubra]SFP95761.1 flagellar hook-associated protein 2 [Sphingomonas rubra]
MAVDSITKTLGSGSGIDLKALVTSLVDAQYAAKTKQFTTKSDTLTAQISGVAKLKSAITGFDSALKSLVKSGSLATQPTSSNAAVLGASLIAGATAPTAATTLTVDRIAQAQAATSRIVVPGETFRGGTLDVTTGSDTKVTKSITVPQGATLADVAALIKKETGFSTALVADGDGTRLTVKSATGASQAFEIAATDTDGTAAGTGLSVFATGDAGLKIGTVAQDAQVTVDGARYTRASNSINNLVPGVKLDLTGTGTTTIAATRPTAALSQAVSDFVATYNELQAVLKEATNATTGVLRSDAAATGIARALSTLTTTKLTGAGTVQTLADIGVATNRDGTLSVDTARLTRTLAGDPAAVEALFADGTGASGGGLSAAMSSIATRLTDKTFGLDAATTRYTRQQSDLATAKAKLADATAATTERMTRQFASMDSRVAAYKSTQTFLTNQIAAWNKSDS